jgi:hypothetical protein
MRPLLLCAGLAALLAAAGAGRPAPAAKPKPVPTVDNVYTLVDCLIAGEDRDLEKVLSTVPGAKGSESPWLYAVVGKCLVENRPLLAGAFYHRGAVAERFLYRDFESIGAAPRKPPAAVFAPVTAGYLAKAEPFSLAGLTLLDAASCVVRSDPARAYAFFRIPRGTAEERAKVAEMVPVLAACLPEGQPLQINPAIFRAVLAEAAYRVAAGQAQVFEGQS